MTDRRELLANATPRPWHVIGPPWNEGAPWINAGSADPHAGEYVCDMADMRDDPDEAASLPNALLIAAAVNDYETLLNIADAARELLGDDDMPHHWADCVCSYCTKHRALINALARLDVER